MCRTSFAFTALFACLLAAFPVFAQSGTDAKAAKRAAKMKADVAKVGSGPDARINVKLGDGSKISGYIREIKDTSFVVVSDQSGAATEIQYSDATKFDRYRTGLSPGKQLLIVAGAVVGGIVLICAISSGCRQ